MRLLNLILLLAFLVCFSGCQNQTEKKTPETSKQPKQEPKDYPEAFVEEPEFEFGVVEVGSKQSHTFTLQNKGTAPLKILDIRKSCQCTIGSSDTDTVMPGESVPVKLTWKTEERRPTFQQTVVLVTNDPLNEEIKLVVTGRIEIVLLLEPDTPWAILDAERGSPTKFEAKLYSLTKEQFQITSLTSNEDRVQIESVPLTEAELKQMTAKSGYRLLATIEPISEGKSLFAKIDLTTDIPQDPLIEIKLDVNYRGFFEVLGPRINLKEKFLDLGVIENKEEVKTEIFIVASSIKEALKVERLKVTPEFLNVTWEPVVEENRPGPLARIKLTVIAPAGLERVKYHEKNLGMIEIETNHPHSKRLKIPVRIEAH